MSAFKRIQLLDVVDLLLEMRRSCCLGTKVDENLKNGSHFGHSCARRGLPIFRLWSELDLRFCFLLRSVRRHSSKQKKKIYLSKFDFPGQTRLSFWRPWLHKPVARFRGSVIGGISVIRVNMHVPVLMSYVQYRASYSATPIYKPDFVHYTVYTKSHTNFHCDTFRHLLMPSSGSL